MNPAAERVHAFIWLDVARAVAAAIVLGGHLRAFLFRDSVAAAHLSAPWKAFYFVTSLQHQAVIVFFVLSGFLISKTISEQAASAKWSWTRYALKRLSRLWIVLLPALALTIVWDQLGMRFTGSHLYSGGLNDINHSTPIGPLSFLPLTFAGNVAFLQSILVPPFGTDTPLWSLANEFWYYVVFPLFFFALAPTSRLSSRIGLFVAATSLCIWLLPGQCALGVVWLLGYGVYLAQRRMLSVSESARRRWATAAALAFGAVLIASKTFKISDVTQDFITGIAFASLLIPIAALRAPAYVTQPARLFAGFSYTLYVLHFPFLAFVTSALLHNVRVPPSSSGLVIFALLFVCTMTYAYIVSLLFERNTPALQALLARNFASIGLSGRSPKIALRTE